MKKTKTKVRRAAAKGDPVSLELKWVEVLGRGAGELIPGMCRVCRCTDDRACVGSCYWADEEHTLCSACVGPMFDAIIEERRRQIAKWGNKFPRGGFLSLSTVLTEEVGEVARAILQGDRPNLEVELVQVMAVCARMLEYLRDGVHHMAIVDHDGLQLREKRTQTPADKRATTRLRRAIDQKGRKK